MHHWAQFELVINHYRNKQHIFRCCTGMTLSKTGTSDDFFALLWPTEWVRGKQLELETKGSPKVAKSKSKNDAKFVQIVFLLVV